MNLSKPLLATLGALGLLTYFLYTEWLVMPDGLLHIYVMDVGQGDSSLIVTPTGRQIVIDGGRDGAPLKEIPRHMSFFDRSIDLLVLSHPELDHISSFPEILRRYSVGGVLMSGVQAELPLYTDFLTLLKEKKIPIYIADPAKDIDLDDGTVLDVLWPPPIYFGQKYDGKGLNNTSVSVRAMENGEPVALFSGDAEEVAENGILETGADLHAPLLKAGHHGSKTSSSTGFLLAVAPREVAISAGKNNSYGHPHKVVTDRYKALGIPYGLTARDGTLTFRYKKGKIEH